MSYKTSKKPRHFDVKKIDSVIAVNLVRLDGISIKLEPDAPQPCNSWAYFA